MGRVCELVSGHTGNVVPRKGLRVRVPCPPLLAPAVARRPTAFSLRGRPAGVKPPPKERCGKPQSHAVPRAEVADSRLSPLLAWGEKGTHMLDVQRIWRSPRLPSLPAAAVRLLDLSKDPDAPLKRIVEVVRTDPALAVRVL